jgi:uncharacterized protein YdaU (DUF1376 family)
VRTPRLSWFKLYPAAITTDPAFVMMSAAARGAFLSIMLYSWSNLQTLGGGVPADSRLLAKISNLTEPEWNNIQSEVLPMFETRDGKLYSPYVEEQRSEALERFEQLAAARRNAKRIRESDGDDEIDRKIDREDEHHTNIKRRSYEHSNGSPNGHPNAPSPLSPPSSLTDCGVSPPHGDPTSGVLPPTSGVPIPRLSSPTALAVGSGTPLRSVVSPLGETGATGEATPDVQEIQKYSHALGWKMPKAPHVQALLNTGASVSAICEAMDEYDGRLNSDSHDPEYAEYQFFVEGGGRIVLGGEKS